MGASRHDDFRRVVHPQFDGRLFAVDLLIKLYAPEFAQPPDLSVVGPAGALRIRKPIGPEFGTVARWVEQRFGPLWSSEAQAALANRPVTLFIAQRGAELLGFCCYDATARGFVGPIGVADTARGQGIGAALLLACLHDMRAAGYGYAIAGHVGEPEFFRRVANAIEIPDSTPGLYAGLLKPHG
jgi:ribosomal protein S18 acetylase RimI-like enzyme